MTRLIRWLAWTTRPMLVSAVALMVQTITPTLTQAATFKVTKTSDDASEGTLRWAITRNNENPGGHVIEMQAPNDTPLVIKLDALLPPIKGPAKVIGINRSGSTPEVTDIVIDGSNFINGDDINSCPGTTTGFGPNVRSIYGAALSVVDSGNVEISGLEIRSFCIGLLGVRSHDNHFHHNKIHNTAGAAGIEFTGDDGTPAGGATTGLSVRNVMEHNIIFDNGDGAEFTRGTSDSVSQFNTFYETRQHGNVPYSQGMEFAGPLNHRNKVLNNTFTGYSDGLQMAGSSDLLIEGNTITASTYAITTSGSKVTIRNNVLSGNRVGVGIGGGPPQTTRPTVTITQNRIFNNGQPLLSLPTSAGGTTKADSPALLGIDIGLNGRSANDLAADCADGFPDCDDVQNFPQLVATSSWSADGKLLLKARLASRPNARFVIEFFANHGANVAGYVEGEAYLGTTQVQTGADGIAELEWTAMHPAPLGDGSRTMRVTATATNAAGSTSEFSEALELTKPASAK